MQEKGQVESRERASPANSGTRGLADGRSSSAQKNFYLRQAYCCLLLLQEDRPSIMSMCSVELCHVPAAFLLRYGCLHCSSTRLQTVARESHGCKQATNPSNTIQVAHTPSM